MRIVFIIDSRLEVKPIFRGVSLLKIVRLNCDAGSDNLCLVDFDEKHVKIGF